MVPPPEVTWNKILTRIGRIHGLPLDELNKESHEDIFEHYWRHISQHHLDQLSIGYITIQKNKQNNIKKFSLNIV